MTTLPINNYNCGHSSHLFTQPLCEKQPLVKRIMSIAFHIFTLGIPLATHHLYNFCFSKKAAEQKETNKAVSSLHKNLKQSTREVASNAVDSPRSKRVVTKPFEISSKVEFGGFNQGGNTCFIAASLQIIRQIPLFRERLNPSYPLKKSKKETDEQYNFRQEIRSKIFKMLEMTDRGNTLDGRIISQLHAMFYSSSRDNHRLPEIQPPGQPGDVHSIIACVAGMLKIKMEAIANKTPNEVFGKGSDLNCSPLLEISYPSNECQGIIIQEEPKVLQKYTYPGGTAFQYKLVGAVTAGYHAIAYVKDARPASGWICCNDASIRKVSCLPSDKRIARLFYRREG